MTVIVLRTSFATQFNNVAFHEEIANSSTIQVIFPEGAISKIVERQYLSIYDDPVNLDFHDTAILLGENKSRYLAHPKLQYDASGIYGVKIRIDYPDNQIPYEKEWSNVIEIKSTDVYADEKNKNEQSGFALILLGIAIITVAPTSAKVLDYIEMVKTK